MHISQLSKENKRMFCSNQLNFIYPGTLCFANSFSTQQYLKQSRSGGGKETNLKPVHLIMLLAIVKGLLKEEIDAICKMRFVFVCGFQLPMLSSSLFLWIIKSWMNLLFWSKIRLLSEIIICVKSIYPTLLLYQALC